MADTYEFTCEIRVDDLDPKKPARTFQPGDQLLIGMTMKAVFTGRRRYVKFVAENARSFAG